VAKKYYVQNFYFILFHFLVFCFSYLQGLHEVMAPLHFGFVVGHRRRLHVSDSLTNEALRRRGSGAHDATYAIEEGSISPTFRIS
jgi:hypothetical protein